MYTAALNTYEKERYKEKKKKFENLSKTEAEGLESLKKRVKAGEIMITTTDKSGRMAILTKDQYVKSGESHTLKDEKLDWKKITYIQNQVNSHTWWLSHIVGNSKHTDPVRMGKNIQEISSQIPEMYILIKDHKMWCEEDNKAIPSRPVLSGNNCLNTHLSELVSELIEPISTRLGGAEVNSTEEALNMISALKKRLDMRTSGGEKKKILCFLL